MKRLNSFIALLLGAALSQASAVQKDEFSKVLGGFVEAAAPTSELDPALGAALAELQSAAYVEAGALTGPLRQMHPDFAAALKIAASDPDAGIAALGELAGSDDPFLAAESSYYLSRVLIGEERFEEALPHLEKIRSDWSEQSLRTGESLYYQGVCNANMLQRTAAADNLNGFVENYSDSSPRLLGAAWDLIAALERVERGSIDDVARHMEFSRRKLGLVEPGEVTQQVQGNIITMLDVLIARAEQQEQQSPPPPGSGGASGSMPGQGSAQGKGNGQMNGSQGNSSAQNAPRVVRRIRGAAESAWDDLRKRDRGTDALGALKSKYPARYRQLVDQYYRSVQEGDKADPK